MSKWPVINIGQFRFSYNGSLTVNVATMVDHEWVNFDAFTLSEQLWDLTELVEHIEHWLEYAIEADPRYRRVGLTREELLYGVID